MEFLGAMGLGGLLIAAFDRWLRRKDQLSDRRYREMREAYSGLLRAIDNRAGLDPMGLIQIESDVRYWVSRVLLVCPKDSLEYWYNLKTEGTNFIRVSRDSMILNMRNDLDNQK